MDKDGNPIASNRDPRMMSTTLDELKKLDNVIGTAGGPEKVDSILAALRGGYLNVLITDEDTASAILDRC